MSTRFMLLIVISLIVVSTLVGLLFWNQLPDQMASHWGINDQVDDTTSKFWGVFLMPLVTTGLLLLFLVIPSIDPLKANIAQFRGTFNLFIVLMIIFMIYIYGLTLAWNLGYTNFRMSSAMLPALGLLFIFLGSLIQKSKRNFFIGIRTPWTLSSDTVWDETHRVGGSLFKISGALALVGALFPDYAFWFFFIPLICTALFSISYSYIVFMRETKTV
jgi:uncharacterized membrane protein